MPLPHDRPPMLNRLRGIAGTWWLRHRRSPWRVLRWLLLWLPMGTAIVLATPLALVLWPLGVRFLGINHRRIGHLAVEPDCFAKERELGRHRGIVAYACAPAGEVCNPALLDCWRPHIRWVTTPWRCRLLTPLAWHPLLSLNIDSLAPQPEGGCRYIACARHWEGRPPLVVLPRHIEQDGAAALRRMGLPEDAWFVCVHNREGGYARHEEDWHAYRNCSIESYLPAIRAITAAGGWCLRIGDPSLTPLPALPQTVDCAHHPLRCDWLDLYLLARCRFFLGNSSGPFLVSCIFGRPVALANMTPAGAVLPYGRDDIGIPKLVRRGGSDGALLHFAEMLAHPSSGYHFSDQFARAGLAVVNNGGEEILALAREMLDAAGARVSSEDDALQADFRRLLRPVHLSFGSPSRVGREFLRHQRHLLS